LMYFFFFFFQAEDGIRDLYVTGVQTCALPISAVRFQIISALNKIHQFHPEIELDTQLLETVLAAEIMGHYRSYQILELLRIPGRSEERRVGKECRCRWSS